MKHCLMLDLVLGELKVSNQRFSIKGARSKAFLKDGGDAWAAVVQANVTYYNSAYFHLNQRLHGKEKGEYLNHIGDIVARFSTLTEPILKRFLMDQVKSVSNTNKGNGIQFLDIGCGSGIFLNTMSKIDKTAGGVGLEMDEKIVNQANINLEQWKINERFKVLNKNVFDFISDETISFDIISFFNIAYYFRSSERIDLFVKLKSALSNKGYLSIAGNFHGKGLDFGAAHLNLATTSMKGCFPIPTVEAVQTELKQTGFTKIKPIRFFPNGSFYGIEAQP